MSLRSLLLDQIWLKLFSLVLATLIWLAVWTNLGGERVSKFSRSFSNRPILILTESSERPTLNVVPDRATVTVRGPVDLIQAMKDEDISVFVRVVDPKQPVGDLPVQVHVPAGASVYQVVPMIAQVRTAITKAAVQP
jgi:hypothetical protein